jgi:hypothetical protein
LLGRERDVVNEWIDHALAMPDLSSYRACCGVNVWHVKHAVVLLVWVMRRFAMNPHVYTYERALHEVLQMGGDTDTNACICGYLAGALCGVDKLPADMVSKVMSFDCSGVAASAATGRNRPSMYAPGNVPRLLERMLQSGKRRPPP